MENDINNTCSSFYLTSRNLELTTWVPCLSTELRLTTRVVSRVLFTQASAYKVLALQMPSFPLDGTS